MANFKTSKNILHSKTEYSRYFSAFRGVDFSSDHTEVNDSRFAYAVNMYKDYRSGQGDAVETIPGFRRIFENFSDKIYGIHTAGRVVYLHVGNELLFFGNLDKSGNFYEPFYYVFSYEDVGASSIDFKYFPFNLYNKAQIEVCSSYSRCGDNDWIEASWEVITLAGTSTSPPKEEIWIPNFAPGDHCRIKLKNNVVCSSLEAKKSNSFYFHNALYLLDGTNFIKIEIVQDSTKNDIKAIAVKEEAYVPTTHIAIDPGAMEDSNPDDSGAGREHEQRNILTPKVKSTFVAHSYDYELPFKPDIPVYDSQSFIYYGPEAGEDNSSSYTAIFPSGFKVYQYGTELPWACKCTGLNSNDEFELIPGRILGYPNAVVSLEDGVISLLEPPPAPEDMGPEPFPSGYAGIEIVAKKATKSISGIAPANGDAASIIEKCTIATVFDNRIFLSGNPEYPKHIFWSGIVKETGRPDPTYFGILNYDQEGVGDAPVVAMLPVADTLMVLKRDAEGEGSVLFHTASSTGEDVYSRIYPSTQGLYGVGCLGPCINFRDDPIFLSKYGVEAMGQLSVRYERAIEHRSSLIDAKLINCDLRDASIAEWEGYLLVLSRGRIFMADSRQMFTHESGVNQYEWYYLDDIGVYDGQFDEYVYAALPVNITSEEILALTGGLEILEASRVRGYDGTEEDLIGSVANVAEDDVKSLVTSEGKTLYYRELPERDERGSLTGNTLKYYVEKSGAKTGGTFDPAVMLKVVGGDIFFATEGGTLCKFNFDKRDKETGIIPNEYYDFNGRRIFSGIATKMDNCGIPHLTKNTVKRSTVIKTRTFKNSSFKVKVRTNRKSFHQVGRIINGRAVLEDTDFSSFTFSTEDKSLFSINEKEKKWVEKQHFIYSDEFRRPFAIHYLAYRYNVAGRYKE